MTLSEFQKKKLCHVFKLFFDVDHNNIIDWRDFECAVDRFCESHNWPKDGSQREEALSAMKLVWEGLQARADGNKDGHVTVGEWLKMWEEESSQLPEWQTRYMELMFSVNDKSGDGIVDVEEYTQVYKNYGISTQDCHKAYDKFSAAGPVDRARFSELWTQYFTSSDPNDAGNFLFGPIGA